MKIIMYIGKTRALLGCLQENGQIDILHERNFPAQNRTFYWAADLEGEINITRWAETLDMYLESQNQDKILIETWLKSTPQILTHDQSIQAETPFGEPPLESFGGNDDIPY